MSKEKAVYLPLSARRYKVTPSGKVFAGDNELPTMLNKTGRQVCLEWVLGKRVYPVALLVIVTYGKLTLPEHLWDEVIPMFIDDDVDNAHIANLTYRFRTTPLPVEGYPGFNYIPFFTSYAINEKGDLLSLLTGKMKTWAKTLPSKARNSTGGYHYSRVKADVGSSSCLFRHRALCLVYKPYPATVRDLVVNHKDGVPENDETANLEWSTYSENNQHAYDSGLRPNAQTPILMKNLQNGTIKRFESVASCARSLGYKTGTVIYWRMNKAKHSLYPDYLQFKLDDDTEWPIIEIDEDRICRHGGPQAVMGFNVFTREVHIFEGLEYGERLTGVKKGTISNHLQHGRVIPTNGFNFRYRTTDAVWPKHTARHLEIYRKYPKKPPNGVIATDIDTGEEFFYCSREDTAEAFKTTVKSITHYLSTKKAYKRKYQLTYFRLRDHL